MQPAGLSTSNDHRTRYQKSIIPFLAISPISTTMQQVWTSHSHTCAMHIYQLQPRMQNTSYMHMQVPADFCADFCQRLRLADVSNDALSFLSVRSLVPCFHVGWMTGRVNGLSKSSFSHPKILV